MKKIISLLGALVFCMQITNINAQEKEPVFENSGNQIGAFVGGSSGYGLSYRYFKNKNGVQIATIPIFSKEEAHFSIGAEYLHSLYRVKRINLYSYVGYHFNYQKNQSAYDDFSIIGPYNVEYDYYRDEKEMSASIFGIGVGFELMAGNHVGFNWQFGYGFCYKSKTKEDWRTIVDAGFGIYFKF